MGIRGLTTFIDSHPELLTDFELHDTRVIIDGNNLYHFLYYYYRVPHEYGGDYDHFFNSCVSFFESLRSCGIEPYVVFDGAYAADGQKFYTSMSRARDRIRLSALVASGVSAKILPILVHDVFCGVLKHLKVPHIMCDYEADRQVAALANQWQCPVLTNDSDFFVFNVNGGVILLDYMNVHVYKRRSGSEVCKYLKVQVFYCGGLMRLLKINDHALMVLFATLLGNDIVEAHHFDSFFARTKLPKASARQSMTRRQVKIASLIDWLQTMHSVRDAVSQVLSHICHDQRDRIKSLIQQSIVCYTDLVSTLHEYFESGCKAIAMNLSTLNGVLLPDWFQRRIQSCDIPVALINVVTNRRLLLLSQVEQLKETSSYCCSRFLRRVAYGILLSVDAHSRVNNEEVSRIVVSEYDREQKSLQKTVVEPIWQLSDKPVPNLCDLQETEPSDRFQFLLAALGTESDVCKELPCDIQFLIAIARYWILHARPKVMKLHVISLLLCFLKLGALDRLVTRGRSASHKNTSEHPTAIEGTMDSSVVDAGVSMNTNDLNEEESSLFASKLALEKFAAAPRHNNAHVFDAAVVHLYCQFQTCLQAGGFVAKLLCLPETLVDPANAVSGTVLYNAFQDLRSRRDPDLYVAELLRQSPELWHCYSRIFNVVLCNLPVDCFDRGPEVVRKRTKRKKASKLPCDVVSGDASEHEQSSEDVSGSLTNGINCDVSNKFSLLGLTES